MESSVIFPVASISSFGKLDGKPYSSKLEIDATGKITGKIPRGLEEAKLSAGQATDMAVRGRLQHDGELSNGATLLLGTVNGDIKTAEFIYYKAATLLLKIVSSEGKEIVIKDPMLRANYENGRKPYVQGNTWTDIYFDLQKDGRHRSRNVLPDEKITLFLNVGDYAEFKEQLEFKEGETQELTIRLQRDAPKAIGELPRRD